MKLFGSWEIPPLRKKKEEHEEVPAIHEYIPAEEPESLNTEDLIEKACHGDVTAVADAFDAYVDGWQEYVSGRDLFFSEDVRALRDAKGELIKKAKEVTESNNDDFRALLDDVKELGEKVRVAGEAAQQKINERRESDATPKELKSEMSESISKISELLPEDSIPEHLRAKPKEKIPETIDSLREKMKVAESNYFLYGKDIEPGSFLSGKSSNTNSDKINREVHKKAYDRTRIAYANALTESAATRLLERYPVATNEEGIDINEAQREATLKRYNTLVRYNEVVRPFAEMQNERRLKRLERKNGRERGRFVKSVRWLARQNAKLEEKYGKTQMRVARAVATTTVLGLSGAAGAFAGAGVLALAGWGSFRIMKSLANSAIGAFTGAFAGRTVERSLLKKSADSREKLRTVGRKEGDLTIDDLDAFDKERAELFIKSDESSIQKKKMIAQVLGAFVGGAGVSILESLPSVYDSFHQEGAIPPVKEPSVGVKPSVEPSTTPSSNVAEQPSAPLEPEPEVKVDTHPKTRIHTVSPLEKATAPKIEPAPKPILENNSVVETQDVAQADITPLPEGMDPDSSEAAYFNQLYNSGTIDHGTSVNADTAPESVPSAPIQLATTDSVHEMSGHNEVPTDTTSHGTVAENTGTQHPESSSDIANNDVHTDGGTHEATLDASESTGAEHAEAASGTTTNETSTLGSNTPYGESVITNARGILIDPKAAHLYESTATKDYYVLWGGASEQRDMLVKSFYENPANETKVIMYISPDKSLITGQNRVGFFSSAGPQVNSLGGFKQVLPPKLDTFTKIVQ